MMEAMRRKEFVARLDRLNRLYGRARQNRRNTAASSRVIHRSASRLRSEVETLQNTAVELGSRMITWQGQVETMQRPAPDPTLRTREEEMREHVGQLIVAWQLHEEQMRKAQDDVKQSREELEYHAKNLRNDQEGVRALMKAQDTTRHLKGLIEATEIASSHRCLVMPPAEGEDPKRFVSQRTRRGNWTLLHHAAQGDRVFAIHYLAERGAEVDAIDPDGWTAMHVAAINGRVRSIDALLQHGAAVDCLTVAGETPRDLANFARHPEAAKRLEIALASRTR